MGVEVEGCFGAEDLIEMLQVFFPEGNYSNKDITQVSWKPYCWILRLIWVSGFGCWRNKPLDGHSERARSFVWKGLSLFLNSGVLHQMRERERERDRERETDRQTDRQRREWMSLCLWGVEESLHPMNICTSTGPCILIALTPLKHFDPVSWGIPQKYVDHLE